MVVAVGLTEVDPLAEVEVNVPGAIATLVAPDVAQLNVLLDPDAMLVGLEVNELIVGFDGVAVTVTEAVAVTDPALFVAVKVYVVVVVGLTEVDPLAEVDVNVPGVIATLVAPDVAQVNVLLDPDVTLVGLAVNDEIVGAGATEPFTVTSVVATWVPFEFVAVKVYVVLFFGETFIEPFAAEEV